MGSFPTSGSQGGRIPSTSTSFFHKVDLECQAARLLDASMAQHTHKAYDKGIKAFDDFRLLSSHNLLWPPPVQHIIEFVSYLSLKGSAPNTAKSYLSGIGFKCKMLGCVDVTQNFIIKKLLVGFSKVEKRVDARLPITPSLLSRITEVLPTVCSSMFEASLFSAAFSLAFFGFLRVGELVADSTSFCNHTLLVSNVNFVNSNMTVEVLLASSKTDQRGEGTVISLNKINSHICPVTLLKAYIDARPKQFEGPLFIHFGGSPVTRYQFCSVLKKAFLSIGLDAKKYTSHSLRIGAASNASAKGIADDQVKEFGRWESRAFKTYIRIPTDLLK